MRHLKPLYLVSFCIMIAGCGNPTVKIISADGLKTAAIKVEVADNAVERARGLMERQGLSPDSGMLFVFPEPQILTFWMKNTRIPLEIIFFDQDGVFVNAVEMAPCKEDPCTRYSSQALAQYAIELPPGFREKNNIGVGSKLDLNVIRKIARPT